MGVQEKQAKSSGVWWFQPQNHQRAGMIAVTKSRNKASSSRRSVRRKRKTCGLKLGVEVEPSSAGFHQWFTTKPLEVSWLRLKAKSGGSARRRQHRTGLTGGGRGRREGLKRRTRVGITWLASRRSKVRCLAVHPMEKSSSFQFCPRWACIDLGAF